MTPLDKFIQMFEAIILFAAIVALVLFLADRFRGKAADRAAAVGFVLPAVGLLCIGLLYPAVLTLQESFFNRNGKKFVGLDNYATTFTSPELLLVLRNTFIWVLVTPFFATALGLVYAVVVDRAKSEKLAKAAIFLPMAISFVGASIIWKFVYAFRPADTQQIGIANQVLVWLHQSPYNFLLNDPWNTLFLIVVMVWIQAGFAMTILSAAIKAIPDDIVEAARLDGVTRMEMFRFVTVPSIRPATIVVLTTIAIGTLKVFDIVRTMTGGNFNTSVLASSFYQKTFVEGDQGLGAALAVVLFVLVSPIVIYNVRQMRKADA